MKSILALAGTMLLTILPAAAQQAADASGPGQSAPVLTLPQSIDEALANGDDNRLLRANLELARSQHAENVSRNSWGLGGSAGAGYNLPGGDTGVLNAKQSSLSSITASTQGAQLGLSAASPLTSLSVTASPWAPPVLPLGTTVAGSAGDSYGFLGLNVSQTLWNGYPGGPTQATVDKSLLALQGRVISTSSGQLNVVYRVKQAYYALLTAQENAVVTRQILDKQNGLLAQITAVYKLKQASEVDLKTAQINARSAQVDVENADHGVRIARIQLALLMGRSPDSIFTVVQPEAQAIPASSLQEAISLALSHRVDFQQLELNRKSNQVDLALARGQATPTVSV
ncbi:MAG TPA: TolC family protein, partial [Spirochaetia bacterium]|nr:TolC family protein [Spirochaetia bacterium]